MVSYVNHYFTLHFFYPFTIELQGKDVFREIDNMSKRLNNSYEENCRLFKILKEDRDRAIRMCNEEWDAFEKVVRYSLRQLELNF